jgi:hypothetical protein
MRQAIYERLGVPTRNELSITHLMDLYYMGLPSRHDFDTQTIPVDDCLLSQLVAIRHAAQHQRQLAAQPPLHQPSSFPYARPDEQHCRGEHQSDSNERRPGHPGGSTDRKEQHFWIPLGRVERRPRLPEERRSSDHWRSRGNKRSAQEDPGPGVVLFLRQIASCVSNT